MPRHEPIWQRHNPHAGVHSNSKEATLLKLDVQPRTNRCLTGQCSLRLADLEVTLAGDHLSVILSRSLQGVPVRLSQLLAGLVILEARSLDLGDAALPKLSSRLRCT